MKRKQLEEMSFENLMQWALDNLWIITTEDMLKEYAIGKVENDDFGMAIHILNAIWENPYETEYYKYDYSMGKLETPTPINSLDDIEDFIHFEEELESEEK